MITKKEKGITLIALVITIIVLLILAGVTLATITGYDGILPNAKKATESYKEGVGNDQEIINTLNDLFEEYLNPNGGGHHNPEGNIPHLEIDESTLGLVGYYADLNGDGQITLADDGIIYADLSKSVRSYWGIDDEDVRHEYGKYAYSASTDTLKDYEIISEKSSVDPFGTGKGIVRVEQGSEGADRFYVMALQDVAPNGTFTSNQYYWYWYKNLEGHLPSEGLEQATDNDFGQGQSRTQAMISLWNNGQYAKTINSYEEEEEDYFSDIWVVFANANNNEATVTNKIDSSRWWVPSKSEWTAFTGNLGLHFYSADDDDDHDHWDGDFDLSGLHDINEVILPHRGDKYNDGEIEAYWLATAANDHDLYGLRFDEECIYTRGPIHSGDRGIRPVVMLDKNLEITRGKTNSNIGEYIDLRTNPLGLANSSQNWKILYVDDSTVYAILADILPNSNECVKKAEMDTSGDYCVGCPDDPNVDAYCCAEVLLDTECWKDLGGEYSNNVIGTPTLEMIYNAIVAIGEDDDIIQGLYHKLYGEEENNEENTEQNDHENTEENETTEVTCWDFGLQPYYYTSSYINYDEERWVVMIYFEANTLYIFPADGFGPSLRLTTRY